MQEASAGAPLTLYSSSDLQTWKRISGVPFEDGTLRIHQDHPDLDKNARFFQIRITCR
ncbi:MAG: hypothetical protein ACJAT3_002483 [Akkermansiaceae bacterium]